MLTRIMPKSEYPQILNLKRFNPTRNLTCFYFDTLFEKLRITNDN